MVSDNYSPPVVSFIGGGFCPPVAVTDDQAALAESALREFDHLLIPATQNQIKEQLSSLYVSCKSMKRTDGEMKVLVFNLLEDLSHLPIDILAESCKLWRQKNVFVPTACEILDIATPLLSQRKRERDRLEVLLRVHANPAPDGEATFKWKLDVTRGLMVV